MMYLVVAVYKIPEEHFGSCFPILITADLHKAIRTARSAEDLGYRFTDKMTEICVVGLEPEKEYRKEVNVYQGLPSVSYPRIMHILKSRGERFESWADQVLRARFPLETIKPEQPNSQETNSFEPSDCPRCGGPWPRKGLHKCQDCELLLQ